MDNRQEGQQLGESRRAGAATGTHSTDARPTICATKMEGESAGEVAGGGEVPDGLPAAAALCASSTMEEYD